MITGASPDNSEEKKLLIEEIKSIRDKQKLLLEDINKIENIVILSSGAIWGFCFNKIDTIHYISVPTIFLTCMIGWIGYTRYLGLAENYYLMDYYISRIERMVFSQDIAGWTRNYRRKGFRDEAFNHMINGDQVWNVSPHKLRKTRISDARDITWLGLIIINFGLFTLASVIGVWNFCQSH